MKRKYKKFNDVYMQYLECLHYNHRQIGKGYWVEDYVPNMFFLSKFYKKVKRDSKEDLVNTLKKLRENNETEV